MEPQLEAGEDYGQQQRQDQQVQEVLASVVIDAAAI
jgi:hypothetical protein